MRGEIITLKDEVRFIDAAAMEALEAQVKEQVDALPKVRNFCCSPNRWIPIANGLRKRGRVDGVTKAAEGKELEEEITTAGSTWKC